MLEVYPEKSKTPTNRNICSQILKKNSPEHFYYNGLSEKNNS